MKRKILIIDDDIITLKILKKYLDNDYEVFTENAGHRFVEKMDKYEADLILLDMEMPIMNGLQVFDYICKEPRFKNTPVAFLSGVSSPELVRGVMVRGAAGYFLKTAPKADLLAHVAKTFAEADSRKLLYDVLIMDANIEVLKSMKKTLEGAEYKVKILAAPIQAVEYLQRHKVDLMIIGKDVAGNKPSDIMQEMDASLQLNRTKVLLMNEPFFSDELLEKVREVFE